MTDYIYEKMRNMRYKLHYHRHFRILGKKGGDHARKSLQQESSASCGSEDWELRGG